ncbi:MAG: sugar nucleotide-binding protein [Candidatus Glassbacteria bacterium]
MSQERLVITGGSGFLGSRLAEISAGVGWQVCATCCDNRLQSAESIEAVRLDLRDRDATRRLVVDFKPLAVVHTAYRQDDRDVTLGGTLNLLAACRELENPPYLLFTSTDLVFDGRQGNYTEADRPEPLIAYGRDKLDAENAVQKSGLSASVVRTALMYDFGRVPRHLSFAVEAVERGGECRLFVDEFRSPVFVDELARGLLAVIGLRYEGVLHMAGADRMDRYGFGIRLLKALGYPSRGVSPGTAAASGLVRPADCSLDSSAAEKLLGIKFRGVRELLPD